MTDLLTDDARAGPSSARPAGARARGSPADARPPRLDRGLPPGARCASPRPSGDDGVMRLVVLCPHFDARRRADRRGDDQHRRPSWSARGHRLARRHVAAVVPAPRASSRAGTGQLVRARGHAVGPHHPGPPVPDRQAQHPGPRRGLRRLHRCWPASRGAVDRSRPDARARHVAAAHARARRLGRGARLAACRSCSTSRTSSPTSPSSWALITDPRVIAAAPLARADHLPARRRRHRAVRRPARQRGGEDRRPAGPATPSEGPGDPELRRHRAGSARRPTRTPTGASTASPARRW